MPTINLSPFPVVTALLLLTVLCLVADPVLAQGSDEWVKPATGLIEALRSGLVTVGALVVGLMVVGRAIFMVFSGNPDWQKIGVVILGGVLIMAGPAAIAALLETIDQT